MAATTSFVQFLRKLANGNTESAGNRVQLEDADGEPLGTVGNPIVTSGGGGGVTSQVQLGVATPVMSALPDYIAGDCIGVPMSLLSQGTGSERLMLRGAFIKDNAGQAPALTVLFFDGTLNGAGGTYTDNSPVVWGTGDKAKIIGSLSIGSANYQTVAGLSVQTLSNIDMPLSVSGTNLGVLVVAAGAYNGAATNDLSVTLWWRLASV